MFDKLTKQEKISTVYFLFNGIYLKLKLLPSKNNGKKRYVCTNLK